MIKKLCLVLVCLWSQPGRANTQQPIATWDVPTSLGTQSSTVINVQLWFGGWMQVEERVYTSSDNYYISRGIRGLVGYFTYHQLESYVKKLSNAELMSQSSGGPCEGGPCVREGRELRIRVGWNPTSGSYGADLRTVFSRQHCSVPETVEPLYERDEALQLTAALETLGYQFLSGQ